MTADGRRAAAAVVVVLTELCFASKRGLLGPFFVVVLRCFVSGFICDLLCCDATRGRVNERPVHTDGH